MAITIPILTTYDAKGIDKASRDIKKAEGGWAKAGAGIKAAAKPAAVGLAALAGAGILAVKSGEEAATAQAALDKVFRNMGYSENAKAASDYASELEALTGIDDKVIKGAQTKLATFDAVSKDTKLMARTTELAADLMASGYGDIETQAQGLGKALQDPAKGLALLTEQGALTSAQQEKIASDFEKTGDKAAAQEAILSALEKQVGGVATATANDSDKIAAATGNVSEAFGLALLPALETVTPWLIKMAEFFEDNTGPILAVAGAVGTLAAAVLVINAAMKVWAAISAVVTAVNYVLGTSFTVALGPIGLIILAIAAVIAIGVLLYKNWDKISAFLKKIWDKIKKFAVQAFDAIKAFIAKTWDQIKSATTRVWDKIKSAVSAVFRAIRTVIVGYFNIYKTIVTTAWNVIKRVFTTVMGAIKTVVRTYVNAYKTVISTVFNAIKSFISSAVAGWKRIISTALSAIKSAVNKAMNLVKAIFRGDWREVLRIVTAVGRDLMSLVRGFPGRIVSALGNLGSLLYNKGRDLVRGLIDGIKSMLGSLASAAGGLLDKLNPFTAASSAYGYAPAPSAVSLARSTAPTSRAATGGVTINVYDSADPRRTAAVVKRAIEGYDVTQGRTRGQKLATAW